MKKISVEVHPSYVKNLTSLKSPLVAIEELIWNALDADARRVWVELSWNEMGGLDQVMVRDTGLGIDYEHAMKAFKLLGGSEKVARRATDSGRQMHGKAGRGRFRALGLGRFVTWITAYRSKDSGELLSFAIRGSSSTPEEFEVSDPQPAEDGGTGTTVRVSGIEKKWGSLDPEDAVPRLTAKFALYLTRYSGIEVRYGNVLLRPELYQVASTDYIVGPVDVLAPDSPAVRSVEASLTVIEWKDIRVEREMVLCDAEGFVIKSVPVKIHASGYEFTAYLRAPHFGDLGEELLDELDPAVEPLVHQARSILKQHFRDRDAQKAAMRVQEWQAEEIYPYKGEAATPVDQTERDVFDILAVTVDTYLKDFREGSPEGRRLTFELLKHAIEHGPSDALPVLQEVLRLPAERMAELNELLKRTTLESIITAAKQISDRLNFLRGLDHLVFEFQDSVLERSQLHRIVARETWIFGEQYHLTVNDESLTRALEEHLRRTDRDVDLLKQGPVKRVDGRTGIIDLMLSRTLRLPDPNKHEHLVVELKRPDVKLSRKALDQTEDYAKAVASDARFRDTDTQWTFWAVSNEIDESARDRISQGHRTFGIFFEKPELKLTCWAKTWGMILNECDGRMRFYQERLNYNATRDSGLDHLRKTYSMYLPPPVLEPERSTDGEG